MGQMVDFYKEAASKFPDHFKRALRGLNGKLDAETLKKVRPRRGGQRLILWGLSHGGVVVHGGLNDVSWMM